MKTLVFAALLSFVLVPLTSGAQSIQWNKTNFPNGGVVNGILSFQGGAFAGTDYGVFRSLDSGLTWTRAGLGEMSVWCFAQSQGIIAGTDSGVYRSQDNGSTWSPLGASSLSAAVYALNVNGNTILAATDNGVYRSTNNGNDWSQVGIASTTIFSFGVSSQTIYAGTYGAGAYRSTNGGATWTAAGLSTATVYSFLYSGSTLYAGTDGGIMRLGPGGQNWLPVTLTSNTIYSLTTEGSTFIAGTDNGIYRSSNGTSYSQVTLAGSTVYAVSNFNSITLAGAAGEGVYRSTDNGAHFSESNSGLSDLAVSALAISGSEIFAGTTNGVYRSTDGGSNWTASGPAEIPIASIALIGKTIYAGTYGDYIYQSASNASNWSQNTSAPGGSIYAITSCGANLYCATDSGIYQSTDLGASWVGVTFSLSPVFDIAVQGATLYAASGDGVYVSNDSGFTWLYPSAASPVAYSVSLSGGALFAGSDEGVYESNDNGETWSQVVATDNAVIVDRSLGKIVLAGSDGSGVYASIDKGAHWGQASSGLEDLHVNSIGFASSNIFLGLDDGVYSAAIPSAAAGPVISSITSVSVCQGKDTSLHVSVAGGAQPYRFSWTNGDGTAIASSEIISGGGSSDSSIRIAPTTSGSIRVVATDAGNASDTIVISITVTPTPDPIITQQGNTLVCNINGAVYQWYDALGQKISGATSSTYNPQGTGSSFAVEVTVNGCSATSNPFTFTRGVVTTNTSIFAISSLSPDPADGFTTVYYSSVDGKRVSFDLRDMLGVSLRKYDDTGLGTSRSLGLDLHGIASGAYLLIASDGSSECSVKLLLR